jgi:hypothetical protein
MRFLCDAVIEELAELARISEYSQFPIKEKKL